MFPHPEAVLDYRWHVTVHRDINVYTARDILCVRGNNDSESRNGTWVLPIFHLVSGPFVNTLCGVSVSVAIANFQDEQVKVDRDETGLLIRETKPCEARS